MQVPAARTKLLVAVPTYRRPGKLAALLAHLLPQMTTLEGTAAELLVIDNDPDGGGAAVVHAAISHGVAIHYRHVPEPGLSVVRNAALAFAAPSFEYVAMIDDDMAPDPAWLHALLDMQRRSGADAVIGAVRYSVPPEIPASIRLAACFRDSVIPHGARLQDGYSGNCLISVAALCRLGLSFDPLMNLAGGEDQLFFRQFSRQGGRIIYSAQAVAVEPIGPERATLASVLFRSLLKGNILALCDLRIGGTPAPRARRAAKAAAIIAGGLLLLPPRLLSRRGAGAVDVACDLSRGIGMLAGLVGIHVLGYSRSRRNFGIRLGGLRDQLASDATPPAP